MTSRRRIVIAVVVSLVVIFVGVVLLPTRAWFGQRTETSSAEAELRQLESSNAALSKKIKRLSQPNTVEQQARELYGFVYPGQESYTVPPRGASVVNLPDVWPFDRLAEPLQRAAQRKAVPEDQVGG